MKYKFYGWICIDKQSVKYAEEENMEYMYIKGFYEA